MKECVCVCVRERKRERERVCACVCKREREREANLKFITLRPQIAIMKKLHWAFKTNQRCNHL